MTYNVYVKSNLTESNQTFASILGTGDYKTTNYETFDELVTMINTSENNIVLLSGFNGAKHCYEICKLIKGKFYESSVILVANGFINRYSKLKEIDLASIIDPKSEESEIAEALSKAKLEINKKNKDIEKTMSMQVVKEEPVAAVTTTETPKFPYIDYGTPRNNIITVSSMRGGTGKTTIATNLAAAYANYGYKVCLVDMALQFGDIYLYNNVKPTFTLFDVISQHLNNSAPIENYLTKTGENLYVLPGPTDPEQACQINPNMIDGVFVKLSREFDVVITDTSAVFNDITLEVSRLAKDILLIGNIDLATTKNCKLFVETLKRVGLDGKIKLVVNKVNEVAQGLTFDKFKKLVDLPVFATIPADYYRADEFVSLGVPFVNRYPYDGITRSFESMVAKLNLTGEDL